MNCRAEPDAVELGILFQVGLEVTKHRAHQMSDVIVERHRSQPITGTSRSLIDSRVERKLQKYVLAERHETWGCIRDKMSLRIEFLEHRLKHRLVGGLQRRQGLGRSITGLGMRNVVRGLGRFWEGWKGIRSRSMAVRSRDNVSSSLIRRFARCRRIRHGCFETRLRALTFQPDGNGPSIHEKL